MFTKLFGLLLHFMLILNDTVSQFNEFEVLSFKFFYTNASSPCQVIFVTLNLHYLEDGINVSLLAKIYSK